MWPLSWWLPVDRMNPPMIQMHPHLSGNCDEPTISESRQSIEERISRKYTQAVCNSNRLQRLCVWIRWMITPFALAYENKQPKPICRPSTSETEPTETARRQQLVSNRIKWFCLQFSLRRANSRLMRLRKAVPNIVCLIFRIYSRNLWTRRWRMFFCGRENMMLSFWATTWTIHQIIKSFVGSIEAGMLHFWQRPDQSETYSNACHLACSHDNILLLIIYH